jgi:predicted helicase
MRSLDLKPSHKAVKLYYETLAKYSEAGESKELTVKDAFADLLKHCCQKFGWMLIQEKRVTLANKKSIQLDGSLEYDGLRYGIWEAKDSKDNLEKEVKDKFNKGYPKDNILFQSPERVIIYQDNKQVFDGDIRQPDILIEALRLFFEYQSPLTEQWELEAKKFGENVRGLAERLIALIDKERKTNTKFIDAFTNFTSICQQAINPNISELAIEEMLIQHLLTERIFHSVFNNSDFTRKNIIAIEIEKVINALTVKSFSRDHFLSSANSFYRTLEDTAATITDFSEKQDFLNTVYEKFFQGFAVKVADTHGIVYTPQPIVNFMVQSVEEILQREFNKSLSSSGVHILDPFVGTGNFILRVMREIAQVKKMALPDKYKNELHCNEIMLLPYYIASMNIEHEYFETTGKYEPFEGICLVDTFSDQEAQQLDFFTPENTARVKKQRETPLFVILGNPPYNAWQMNENDNNKNRKYDVKNGNGNGNGNHGISIDQRVRETYAKDSKATNKNSLSDPYIKAIRWASDRIGDEGMIAFVTNNGFIEGIACDGMRKQLEKDFDLIYILDLGGNSRKTTDNPKAVSNVFDIRVGVSVNFFIKKQKKSKVAKIYYTKVDDFISKAEKFNFLDQSASKFYGIKWQKIKPDQKFNWLTQGLEKDFANFLAIGSKEAKSSKFDNDRVIFKSYSNGINTSRDAWAYNFNGENLAQNIQKMITNYNQEVFRWSHKTNQNISLDDFVLYDESKISWSSSLKLYLNRGIQLAYNSDCIRRSVYRPFSSCYLYFAYGLNHRPGQFPYILPTPETESENQVIWLKVGKELPMFALMVNVLPDLLPQGGSQCFPYYIYDEDGTNRRENITDWALEEFRIHYQNKRIKKWDIFYYVYGILHHPTYRTKYAANLKRELPRIPYAPAFRDFAKAGKKLADLHINYENQAEYPLTFIENNDIPLDLRVEKMRLSKDKTQLIYNDFLTLSGIPSEVFEYKLGNRSALDWIIDQYQVKTDKRSGIINDPNRLDDEQYIIKLIGKVITVSLETLKIIKKLPSLT